MHKIAYYSFEKEVASKFNLGRGPSKEHPPKILSKSLQWFKRSQKRTNLSPWRQQQWRRTHTDRYNHNHSMTVTKNDTKSLFLAGHSTQLMIVKFLCLIHYSAFSAAKAM